MPSSIKRSRGSVQAIRENGKSEDRNADQAGPAVCYFSTVISLFSHLTTVGSHATQCTPCTYLRRALCPSTSLDLSTTPLRSVQRPPFVRSQTAQNNTTSHAPGRAESAQKLTSYIPHCTDSMLMQMHCVRERSALVRSPASCGERPSPPHPGHPYRSWATAAAAM